MSCLFGFKSWTTVCAYRIILSLVWSQKFGICWLRVVLWSRTVSTFIISQIICLCPIDCMSKFAMACHKGDTIVQVTELSIQFYITDNSALIRLSGYACQWYGLELSACRYRVVLWITTVSVSNWCSLDSWKFMNNDGLRSYTNVEFIQVVFLIFY